MVSSIIPIMKNLDKPAHQNPWLLAIRPKTLPAAAAPVIVGSALAFADRGFRIWPSIACLLTALLLQIGSNLANDVYDYEKGADDVQRLGPMRVTQAGILTPKQVKQGMWVVFGFSAVIGITLVYQGGWLILWLGLAAVISAIAYTGGPFPLGYHGLGDLFVFVFFGLVATAGTYYLQIGSVQPNVWWIAAVMGFLTVNILVVNNLRDLESDQRVQKKTLAVRLGERGARGQYMLLMTLSYGIPAILLWFEKITPWVLLTWLSIPSAFHWIRFVSKNSGKMLNKALAGTGKLELIFAVLLAMGMIFSVIIPP